MAARCGNRGDVGPGAVGFLLERPGTNLPAASSAGIPLMNRMPFASLARLNGKPAGSPGPELTRLIVTASLAGASLVIGQVTDIAIRAVAWSRMSPLVAKLRRA